MKSNQFVTESAALDLARKLPSLDKHDYNTIDILMRNIASKHRIKADALHDLFVKKYHKTPDNWIKSKLDEDGQEDYNDNPIMQKFIKWSANKLNLTVLMIAFNSKICIFAKNTIKVTICTAKYLIYPKTNKT